MARVLTDRWLTTKGKNWTQRAIPARVAVFRDMSRGHVGFSACVSLGSPGRVHGRTLGARQVNKAGQYVCSPVESNPRKAVAEALHAIARGVNSRSGSFAGYSKTNRKARRTRRASKRS